MAGLKAPNRDPPEDGGLTRTESACVLSAAILGAGVSFFLASPVLVADGTEFERWAFAAALEAYGKLDVLFNNAGVMTSGDFRSFDEAAWDGVLNPNLRGIYLMCHAAIPHMPERGEGGIVNTSSVMAFLTKLGYEAYTTSKAGIIGLTKALVVSYAEQGVRANCVCPGWVDTPMNRRLAEELGGMDKLVPIIKQQQPLPRMIITREVGNAVCFLASGHASAITAAVLCVDGAALAAI